MSTKDILKKIDRFSYLINLMVKQAGEAENREMDLKYMKRLNPTKEEAEEFMTAKAEISKPVSNNGKAVDKSTEQRIRKERAIKALGKFYSPAVPLGIQLHAMTYRANELLGKTKEEIDKLAKQWLALKEKNRANRVDFDGKAMSEGEKEVRNNVARVKVARQDALALYQSIKREKEKSEIEERPVDEQFNENVLEMLKLCIKAIRYNCWLAVYGLAADDLHLEDFGINGAFKLFLEQYALRQETNSAPMVSDDQLVQSYLHFLE